MKHTRGVPRPRRGGQRIPERGGHGRRVIGGASWGEIGFVALLAIVVVLAPIAPRVGEAIGGLFDKRPGS